MKGLLFTYFLTYGGALASLFDPYIGLLIYICFAIIKPDALWFWSVPAGNYSRIVAIGLLLGWGLNGFGSWGLGRARGILVLLVMFLLWCGLLSLQAINAELAWKFVEDHFKIVLPVVVGLTTIHSTRQLKQLAWVIVLSQGYLAFDFNMSYYSGFNRLQEIGFAGQDNNTVAITMDTCIGLAFFLGLHATSWWQKGLGFAAGLLMVHSIMFSFSRGGLLGLIITGGVAFLLIEKQPRHYLVFLVAILIGIRLAGSEVTERFGTTFSESKNRDSSAGLRVQHWLACADSMLKTPWGVGPNQWRFASRSYGLPSMEAHSYWFQTGAELGLPGLLLIASFYGFCLIRLWPIARGRVPVSDPWLTYTARMVIASLTGFIVSAQFVSVFGVETPFYVALLGAGVLRLASGPVLASAIVPAAPTLPFVGYRQLG